MPLKQHVKQVTAQMMLIDEAKIVESHLQSVGSVSGTLPSTSRRPVRAMPSFGGGPVHHHALVQLWRSSQFCDAEVTVNGQHFAAHRCVLAIGSALLAARFRSGTSGLTAHLVLKEVSAAAFEVALEYMYTGSCSPPDQLVGVVGSPW